MPKFSLLHIILMIAYCSVCCWVYVSINATVGWMLVIATGIMFATVMARAFRSSSEFALGFAIVGSVTLITTLGFAIETKGNATYMQAYELRRTVYLIFCPRPELTNATEPKFVSTERIHHDLYYTQGSRETSSPSWVNLVRLVVSLGSVVIAILGGAVWSLVATKRSGLTHVKTV